ncbi:hypothetical protein APASM_4149 [Actinosynnema pretiosum subsp. pretiosum]|nr:hypothetical protein APASM_4149 [Actinosynnema pretiosum subsp. pretiosum]
MLGGVWLGGWLGGGVGRVVTSRRGGVGVFGVANFFQL